MTLDAKIEDDIEALIPMKLEDLRAVWRNRWGSAPRLRSPDLLRRMIAWKIQAAAFGDLDADTRRALRQTSVVARPTLQLVPGTRLAREWKGVRHDVEVVEGGFAHQGVTYRSLSKVASTIAGAKWNGYRFFGLKELAA